MVSVYVEIQGRELKVKAAEAKLAPIPETITQSELERIWKNSNTAVNIATSKNVTGLGICNLRMGALAKRYTSHSWDDTNASEKTLIDMSKSAQPSMALSFKTNACMCHYSKESTFCAQRIYQATNTNAIRGLDLINRGCDKECCQAYNPFYSIPSNKSIGVVSVEKTTNSPISNEILIFGKDASGVIVQKRAIFPTSGPAVITFQQEDVRPLIFYLDIQGSKGRVGTTNLRFESALGDRWFLRNDGTIAQLDEQNSRLEDDAATKFTLAAKIAATNLTVTSDSIYSIRELNNTRRFLQKSGTTNTVTSDSTGINTDWSIEPAINGAYAYVSLQLVNLPGYYLIAKKTSLGGYRAEVKVIDPNNDLDCFYASWRLYPA